MTGRPLILLLIRLLSKTFVKVDVNKHEEKDVCFSHHSML